MFLLENHRRLQEAFHPEGLPEVGTDEWARYVDYNVVGLVKELGEFLQEVQTSPWKRAGVGVPHPERAAEEGADLLHFIANLLLATGVSEGQLLDAYYAKLAENRARLLEGRVVTVSL